MKYCNINWKLYSHWKLFIVVVKFKEIAWLHIKKHYHTPVALTIWLHPVPWRLPGVWLSNKNQLFTLLFQHHMWNCKGNNNDKKNLCLEELHVYIIEVFLIFIEIFKIWNCSILLLSRSSVAPNDLKSTEFPFQGLMVWFYWHYLQFLLICDNCWTQTSFLCPNVHFYKLILQL